LQDYMDAAMHWLINLCLGQHKEKCYQIGGRWY
jgi:hypothetical protein